MDSKHIKVKINKKDIALFKYILESYDNLVQVSTSNPSEGLVEIYVPSGNLSLVESLLHSLRKEINFILSK